MRKHIDKEISKIKIQILATLIPFFSHQKVKFKQFQKNMQLQIEFTFEMEKFLRQ